MYQNQIAFLNGQYRQRIIINILMQESKQCWNSMAYSEQNSQLKENIIESLTTLSIYPSSQSRSLKGSENHFETSFELSAEMQHAQNVWKSSLEFIKSCFPCDQILLSKGFNDIQLFPACSKIKLEELDLEELILRNKMLKQQQLQQFLFDLKPQKEFTIFLQKISQMFNEEIFQQILYVCHQSWEKYLLFKEGTKINQALFNMNFQTVINLQQQQIQQKKQFRTLTSFEIHQEAEKTVEELAGAIYLSRQIKFINLMEAEINKKKIPIRDQFKKFIASIIKGVFFLIEGYYEVPSLDEDDESSSILSFGNDEQSFLSENEQYEEQELYIYSPARKLRKYL